MLGVEPRRRTRSSSLSTSLQSAGKGAERRIGLLRLGPGRGIEVVAEVVEGDGDEEDWEWDGGVGERWLLSWSRRVLAFAVSELFGIGGDGEMGVGEGVDGGGTEEGDGSLSSGILQVLL